MKKKITALLSALMAFVLCAACSPKLMPRPDIEYNVNLMPDKNTTETLRIFLPSNIESEQEYINALLPGWYEMYPNVKIEFDARSVDDNAYVTSVNAAIASGQVPDLFWTNTAYYYYLISKGCIVNLEPYYKTEKFEYDKAVSDGADTSDKLNIDGDYYKEFFDMSLYEERRYIVPRSMDSVVTYVNTELLAAAGIDYKTDERLTNDWTWEDMVEVCRDVSDYVLSDEGRASKYKDAYGLQAEFDWEAVFNPIMLSYGSQVFDKDGKIAVNTPETKKMADDIRALKNDGRVLRVSTSRSSFTNGNVAFAFSSSGAAQMAKNEQIKGKFDALPFPQIGDEPKIGCGFVGYGISSTTEGVKRDLAWAFLKYMISQEGQMALINGGLATPSIRVDLAEEKQWSKGFQHLNLDAWLAFPERKVASNFFMAQPSEYSFDILNAIQSFMKNLADDDKWSTTRCIDTLVEDLEEAISA